MKGKVALITGAARGIGKAIAMKLAGRGADVVVADINLADSEVTASEIGRASGVKTLALKLDVSNSSDVAAGFAKIMETFGRIDILINNAGITRDALIMRMRDEDWDAVISVNLKSVFLCTREAVKIMAKQRYGRIVSIASIVAFMGNPGQANYAASKAGIVGLTKTTAKEYAKRGITANAVAPGFIMTAMTEALPEKVRQDMQNSIPMDRLGTVEDVANAVAFLASDEASYITGNVIHVNGGMYM
jgi:3-oxoacyl-[acyl-carrier protein] reductase